ncbi:MAG: SRPBCC domain-containing protein [Acidobacteriota bacterium]|nr:MAG: SRPBCC domain-containing protein [Acidobacteriota bacterium]
MSEETRSHIYQIDLEADPETVFDALITPSAICGWWGASTAIVLPEEGGFWNAAWGEPDDPDYITFHRITEYDYPNVIELDETRYYTKFESPPFDLNVKARFEVDPISDRLTSIRVIQSGFPQDEIADEFYAACEKGWHDTFEGLRKYIGSA